jgi:hypothetical protein
MNTRVLLYFALSMPLLLPTALATAAPSPGVAEPMPQLIIYSAKGAPNSCGPGCDRWIAIEGTIDAAAAARVERFFREQKDTQRPIYFNSPGGEMRQAFAIGRLLRGRKAIGRVGRTIADVCPGSQTDDACWLMKTAHNEVAASITTRDARCSSSCSYLLFGTVSREVAPDAVMAVHSPKVVIEFRLNATEKRREEAVAKAYDQADRLASSYIDEMGISRDLLTLVDTVSYESAHVLTRQELYRFRIDTRDFVETDWTVEKAQRPYVRKFAQMKNGDGFRKLEWELFCDSKTRARFVFAYELDKDATGTRIAAMTVGSEKPPLFARFPARVGSYEVWTAAIASDAVKNLFAVPRLGMGQSTLLPDGKATSFFLEIETRGLEQAWTQLSATCLAATVSATLARSRLPPPVPPTSTAVP